MTKQFQFIVTQLRRFQPLVVLGQDLNGEYGHGAHRLTAKALTDAVQLSNQPDYDPKTVEQYGLWDVPKTYLHLYPENRIHMNWNIPLERFGGQTALQMAQAGYLTHESQQWCWFYVSDSYEYSCAEFGLFRSLVGPDVIGGDLWKILFRTISKKQLLLLKQQQNRQPKKKLLKNERQKNK